MTLYKYNWIEIFVIVAIQIGDIIQTHPHLRVIWFPSAILYGHQAYFNFFICQRWGTNQKRAFTPDMMEAGLKLKTEIKKQLKQAFWKMD